MTDEQIVHAFKACKKARLHITSFNMVGLPGESMKEALDTIKLNSTIRPDQMQISISYPYPRTSLHTLCIKRGYIVGEPSLDTYFEDSILRLDKISREQIRFISVSFHILVRIYSFCNLLPRPLASFATQMIDRCLCSQRFPYTLAIRVKSAPSPKAWLRNEFPAVYERVRALCKRVQYR